MEKFNFNPEVNKSEQEQKSYSLNQVKKWLNASMLVGLSLVAVGCESKTNHQPETKPNKIESKDIFDRAEDRADKILEEGEQAIQIARDHGLNVNEGDKVSYKKKYGQIVEVEVNGQKIELDHNSKIDPDFKFENEDKNESKSEIKTNPDINDFLK